MSPSTIKRDEVRSPLRRLLRTACVTAFAVGFAWALSLASQAPTLFFLAVIGSAVWRSEWRR